MTYETVSKIAQQAGTVFFVVTFVIACAYALLPSKKDEFAKAARAALDAEELATKVRPGLRISTPTYLGPDWAG